MIALDRRIVAKSALDFGETGDKTCLKTCNLTVLDEILGSRDIAPGKQSLSLIELLNFTSENPAAVKASLNELALNWNLSSCQTKAEADYKTEKFQKVILDLKPLTAPSQSSGSDSEEDDVLLSAWTFENRDQQILASSSSSQKPEFLSNSQNLLRANTLISLGKSSPKIINFLEARKAMQRFEPWLTFNAKELLLLFPEALSATEKYLEAWKQLATEAIQRTGERPFVESVQVLETVSGPDKNNPDWILLGCLHPYRLDPILKAVNQCLFYLQNPKAVQNVGFALIWTIEHSFPAYVSIYRNKKSLFLRESDQQAIYNRTGDFYLPPVQESSGLERILTAVDSFSPWLKEGLTALVIDPPVGGGVSRAFIKLKQRYPSRYLALYHLATSDQTDPLDNFDGQVFYLKKVSSLKESKEIPKSNLILRFAPSSEGLDEPTSGWKATRGTHLALRIEETVDGPFDSKPTMKIKIDPREENFVVNLTHSLYEASTGEHPPHATLRPLFETDDAPTLSRMANNTDWIVFAAPGPIGLVAPRTINNTLRYVGKASMGNYGLYVYVADDMFPVRRHFERFFQKTPMAAISPEKMVDLLVNKAQESAESVLFSSNSSVPAKIASLVSLSVVKDLIKSGVFFFTLSLDDLGWTRFWHSTQSGQRADFLIISFLDTNTVTFNVVESKSEESGKKIACDSSISPFNEAVQQVGRTLDSLKEISLAKRPNLDQDLRYSSLIEHLMAAAMVQTFEMTPDKKRLSIEIVNKLSRRELNVEFKGFVVLNQAGINLPREVKKINEELIIIWSGNPDVEKSFGLSPGLAMTIAVAEDKSGSEEKPARPKSEFQPAFTASGGSEVSDAASTDDLQNTDIEASSPTPEVNFVPSDSAVNGMTTAFITASKLHGIPISEDNPVRIQIGSSMVVFGVRLREGAKVKDFQNRIPDISRDAGFGDSAELISIENDKEPSVVKVFMPRPDREFPIFQKKGLSFLAKDGSYLPVSIGETIDGLDWESSIESWPHMLVAGTTNSGKTTFLKGILKQAAIHGASRIQSLIIDGKGETDYFNIVPQEMHPKPFTDVVLGKENAINALKWVCDEMEKRRRTLVDLARSNASGPVKTSDLYKSAIKEKRLCAVLPLLVVVDEFAEIMLRGKKDADEFVDCVQRISQVGRSCLVHILLATQRPDRETVRGAIKANLNCRVVFRLPTQADSITVLGTAGAEKLLFYGDMLFKNGPTSSLRLQGYKF
jgi:S-DNA-T family DNA segregation ATPase FtsK/SpoIIIE